MKEKEKISISLNLYVEGAFAVLEASSNLEPFFGSWVFIDIESLSVMLPFS